MKPLLSVFCDGIGYDSLPHMPFVNSFVSRPLLPMFGYSVTCHASMYTGLYPEEHELLFIWKRSPETSPFKWAKYAQHIPGLDNRYAKYLYTKICNKIKGYRGYFGIPRIEYLPYKYWPFMDVAEKKFWDEDDYIPGKKTIFELVRSHNIRHQIVGMRKIKGRESPIVQETPIESNVDWVYLFMGDIDYYTHRYTKESSSLHKELARIDKIIELKYKEMQSKYDSFNFVVWSDHGHVTVKKRVDLFTVFAENGLDLNDFHHCIEATVARFYVASDEELQKVRTVLGGLSCGSIIDASLKKQYHIDMVDDAFGNLLFLLHPSYVFDKTIWGQTTWTNSMHGYDPAAENYQAFVATSDGCVKCPDPDLREIFNAHMQYFGIVK